MIICRTRFLSAKFGHSDYIILTFKAEFVCPACSDFITSSYLNAPEALKLHTNGFSLYYYDIHCVHCYKRPHLTWPQFWCHTAHTWIKTIFWWWKQLLETYHFLMVRLKIAYWEFDFEAVCPTSDHDLLSQAHIYYIIHTLSDWLTAMQTVVWVWCLWYKDTNSKLSALLTVMTNQLPGYGANILLC